MLDCPDHETILVEPGDPLVLLALKAVEKQESFFKRRRLAMRFMVRLGATPRCAYNSGKSA